MKRIPFFTMFMLLSLSGAAAAQETGASPGRGPCALDAQRLCAQHMGGGREAMRNCMRENQSQLSDACRARVKEARQNQGKGPPPAAPKQPAAPQTP